MASLLDLALFRQNPQLGGLLNLGGPDVAQQPTRLPTTPAAPSGNAQAPAPQGEGSFLQRLVAGGNDPALSPAENERIRKLALLQGGIATLAAGGQGQTGLAQIATGLATGQAAASQAKQQTIEAAERAKKIEIRARIGELFGSGEDGVKRADAERALQFALASGDLDTAKAITDFVKTLPEDSQPFKSETVTLADGTIAVFDPNERAFFGADGKPIMELPKDVADDKDKLQYVTGIDPATGEPVSGVINLDRHTFTPVNGVVDPSALKSQQFDPETIQIAERATKARNNFKVISSYLAKRIEENPKNPLRGIRFERARFEQTGLLVPFAARNQLGTETQQFLQAQEAFMLELAHQLAGVRGISQDNARGAIFRTFGFEEGDTVENIQNTLRELETGVRSLELQAGGALGLFSNIDVDNTQATPEEARNRIRNLGSQ